MTEKEFQNRVTSFLMRNDIDYYKTHGGMAYLPSGPTFRLPNGKVQCASGFQIVMYKDSFPDLLIWDHGHFFGIELKTDTGKVKPTQKLQFTKLFMKNRFETYILRPSGWELFKTLYKDLKDLYITVQASAKAGFVNER